MHLIVKLCIKEKYNTHRRTEQVLIELDISAKEKYVIIIQVGILVNGTKVLFGIIQLAVYIANHFHQ